ncbi:hypothetical protein [Streptomyces sp. IB2014 016-6]|uniref:hypothetical protein n=1 Tax=Streptomyces sp. IB2014 016-6 TaxID=2517818 RepID=UPI0011C8FC75|nr:hypothetical protein [Streptomyces sp. IB2014 016-6]TXL86823.1 hypothetical protein EW053_24510 [Streptomyces sp. IB2014 016-6]
MHGPGIAQPPPNGTSSPGMLAFIRVIFVGLPLISCGFLAWAATLRVAIVTRSTLNWWLFVGNVALNVLWVVFLAQDDTDDFSSPAGNTGMIGMLSTGAAAIAYYLYADFKHYGPQRHVYAGYYPPQGFQPPANTGYGYGGPTRPMTGPPVQNQPQPQPQPQNQPPQPNHAAPPRIDQVRAELDELSDLLRRDSGEGDKR